MRKYERCDICKRIIDTEKEKTDTYKNKTICERCINKGFKWCKEKDAK